MSDSDLTKFYRFRIEGFSDTFGHVPPRIRREWFWDPGFWIVCDSERSLTLCGDSIETRDANIKRTLASKENIKSIDLSSIAGEVFPVYSSEKQVLVNIPRIAAPYFGILAYGVQLLAYQLVGAELNPDFTNLKMWLSRRSERKSYFPGFLGVTASGALAAGEDPKEGILRESLEEASLPEEWLRDKIKPTGVLSYVGKSGNSSEEDLGFALPEVDFCYCVRLDPASVPAPMDGEVDYFELLSAPEVLDRLMRRRFTPAAAYVIIDFLIMLGFINYDNEPNYVEIVTRLHHKLLYPTL